MSRLGIRLMVLSLTLGLPAVAQDQIKNSGQGRTRHGTQDPELETVNIPVQFVSSASCDADPDRAARFDGPDLVVTCGGTSYRGPQLVGTTFSAPFRGRYARFTIVDARPYQPVDDPPPSPPSWEFEVATEKQDGAIYELCAQRPDQGPGMAIAVPFGADALGRVVGNDRYFSFACTPAPIVRVDGHRQGVGGGAIAKCINWGYPPWADIGMFQACLAMATADYCGEGLANTFDNTPIGLQDRRAFSTPADAARHGLTFSNHIPLVWPGLRAALPAQMPLGRSRDLPSATADRKCDPTTPSDGCPPFEAIWGVNDAGVGHALCVSQQRYQSLSTEGTCFDRLPRCDEQHTGGAAWVARGGALFSWSAFHDSMLVTFRDHAGHFLTTTHVAQSSPPFREQYELQCGGDGLDCASLGCAGGSCAGVWRQVDVEGPILRSKVSDDDQELGLSQLADGQYVTTTDAGLADLESGWNLRRAAGSKRQLLGFIHDARSCSDPCARQVRPLRLRVDGKTKVHTTIEVADGDASDKVRLLGCVPDIGSQRRAWLVPKTPATCPGIQPKTRAAKVSGLASIEH